MTNIVGLDFEKAAQEVKDNWPRKGEQLFTSDSDWWHNACLNYLKDHWNSYADGYKKAADLLVKHVDNTHSNQDILVYPVVFLYRQHIELRLKILIRDGNQLLDIPEKFPLHHRIDDLWKQCRIILEKVWPTDSAEELEAIEECINQFSEKDPSSMAFRYPTDKDGSPLLPGISHINLRNLAEIITRISSFLDCASMGISEDLSLKHEMESEYNDSSY